MIRLRLFGPPVVSPEFWALSPSGRLAIVAHEAGHKYYGHVWRRWLVWLLWPPRLHTSLYHQQELQADDFAREMGYGPALASALSLQPHPATVTHPSTRERVARLLAP